MLDKAEDLFYAAEHRSAPVDWLLELGIDLMLSTAPNAKGVSELYAAALVDSIMDDPEVWQGYRPGFSAPVIIRIMREIRRMNTFVPTTAEFLELYQKHRQQFRQWQWDLPTLHNLRDDTEWILISLGEVKVEPDDEPW